MQYKYNKTWRQRHPVKRYQSKARYYEKHREDPENRRNTGQRWRQFELELITAPNRPPDSVLAKQFGRSVQAVQGQRHKLLRRAPA